MPSTPEQEPFAALRFADHAGGADHDLVRFEGTDFRRARAVGHSFLECALVDCALDEAHLESSRWSECTWSRVAGVGIVLTDASLVDVAIEGSRLAAVSAWGSVWRNVTVAGGKIDFLNLRGAQLTDVRFVDCVITELDLADAQVQRVSFDGCTLVTPEFANGSYAALDLSGATLREPRGVAALKGAVLSRLQLIDLGELLAIELGITVV